MTDTEILNELKSVMTKGLFIKEDQPFTLETNLGDDLGLDSLDKVEIKLVIEDHFDFEIDNEEFKPITIKDVVDVIKNI